MRADTVYGDLGALAFTEFTDLVGLPELQRLEASYGDAQSSVRRR
jgi:hypothetical protein